MNPKMSNALLATTVFVSVLSANILPAAAEATTAVIAVETAAQRDARMAW